MTDVVAVDDVYRKHGLPNDGKCPAVQALASNLGRAPSAVYMRMGRLDYAHNGPACTTLGLSGPPPIRSPRRHWTSPAITSTD